MEEKKQITPLELMKMIKSSKEKTTEESLINFYNVCLKKLEKYIATGQVDAAKKVKFLIDNVEKEKKLLELGINTFVYFKDISDYIENVKDKQLSIIELSRYEREVPDEIADVVAMCKQNDLFDEYMVLFTDYNKEMSKKTRKQDREKDPILFGIFLNKDKDTACPRFYYLGDWEDEHCDLTLERMLAKIGDDKAHKVEAPAKTLEELTEKLNSLTSNKGMSVFHFTSTSNLSRVEDISSELFVQDNKKKKNSFFSKVKSIFKK